ncbi:DUF4864 domain-containing protein [Candidatus Protochlamydia phocaeensis]|uniref:DUF4864 domain-containing protein n=1 Tax=Candidatus Protochlamydia phocaeensis TaxID=1414722 RepID=UPI00083906AA|nr:DUF4864 domain-containing protein [Candidatus Protochlamydia phocaeensis]
MFCSQCGAKVEKDYKYCPSCGAHLAVNSPSLSPASPSSPPQSEEQAVPTQTVKKKPMPLWFKILIAISVIALIAVAAGILFTERLVDVIDNQLSALRQNDVSKAYYAYTSKDFQAATSLEQFRHFIQAYPAFLQNQSAHFTQRSIENNIGTLKGNLTSVDHVNTPIEYKLIKEDDKWKILSIRLLKPGVMQHVQTDTDMQEIIDVAKAQLQAIQDHQLEGAYQQYSSKEFKEATSLEAFQDFIKRYPILNHYQTASFHKPNIRNGVGTLSAILQSDQLAAYVKYYLIYEDQSWKIWSMRILSPSEELEEEQGQANKSAATKKDSKEKANKEMSFGNISLGDEVDDQGIIETPQDAFDSDLSDLYINLEIKNGLKGSTIYLSLQHLESGSSIPAKATIEDNGDTMLMSVFSPPKSGWPKGHYKLIATTSSGLNKVIDFEIE